MALGPRHLRWRGRDRHRFDSMRRDLSEPGERAMTMANTDLNGALVASRHRLAALPSTLVKWSLSPAVVEQWRECAAGTTDFHHSRSGHRSD
jgi:hypothetical protein